MRLQRDTTHDGGFTLMEVVIVLAIIAIIALMAVPSATGRIVRAQVAEALPLAEVAQQPVALAWAATQAFPADNDEAGLPAADRIVNQVVASVAVQDGAVHITFGQRAHGALQGKVLTLRPAVVEDAPVVPVTWVCGLASAPDPMTVHGVDRTDVPSAYLPHRCL